MTFHLSHSQLCDLLTGTSTGTSTGSVSSSAAREHVSHCESCASELDRLLQPLSLFHEAAQDLALHTSSRYRSRISLPAGRAQIRSPILHSRAFAWATAGVLLCASALPFALHHRPMTVGNPASAQKAPVSELSDEALLEQVDRDLASSVPTPLRPLADPTVRQTSSTAITHSPTVTERTN